MKHALHAYDRLHKAVVVRQRLCLVRLVLRAMVGRLGVLHRMPHSPHRPRQERPRGPYRRRVKAIEIRITVHDEEPLFLQFELADDSFGFFTRVQRTQVPQRNVNHCVDVVVVFTLGENLELQDTDRLP